MIGSFLERRLPITAKMILRRAALRVAGVAYAGSGVTCPCCGDSFRRLAPFKGRPNEQCPACGSLARHRALFVFLSNELALADRTARVLHFAPERALQQWLSSLPRLEYLSADLESPLALVRMDITDIPYSDARFDLIICSHVLEHVADDQRAIRELYRVLVGGGEAIVQVPIRGEQTFEDPSSLTPASALAPSASTTTYGFRDASTLTASPPQGSSSKSWTSPARSMRKHALVTR